METKLHPAYCLLAPKGRIDTMNARIFEGEINELIENGYISIILDLGELEYISSSGLRVVLTTRKKLIPLGGYIRLCNLQPSVSEVFEISGFSNIVPLFIDVDSAVKG
jgi:anti-anti-sigma factor